MYKVLEIYNDIITKRLLFLNGAQSNTSKEHLDIAALEIALISLYDINFE